MHQTHSDRYIPAKTNEGWGIAGLIVGLALVCVAAAWYIHAKTYKHPTDVTWQSPAAAKGAAGH